MIHAEPWFREAAQDLQIQRLLENIRRGSGEAVLEVLRLLIRNGRERDAIRLLEEAMDSPSIPLRAKYEFREMVQNIPYGEDEEDIDWFLHQTRDYYNETWFSYQIADALQTGEIQPTDPLVKVMWDGSRGALPYMPWHLVEQMPDAWVPSLGFEEYRRIPEVEERDRLHEYLHSGEWVNDTPEDFHQAWVRLEQLNNTQPWTEGRRLPLKELIPLIREDYEKPESFTSVYTNKDNTLQSLVVSNYVGISGPVYRWVTEI